jgi:hypothetical protein
MLTKVCAKCGDEKDIVEYHKSKNHKHGVSSECKVCRKHYIDQWREANKEVIAEQRKAHYQANKVDIIARHKSWYKTNKEAVAEKKKVYYQANKEAIAKQKSLHCKDNPHIYNAKSAKRRAKKIQATPAWANKEHIDSLYLIASINREGGYDIHVDHIVPLLSSLVCGLHCEANLQLIPAINNIIKGNRYWPDMP